MRWKRILQKYTPRRFQDVRKWAEEFLRKTFVQTVSKLDGMDSVAKDEVRSVFKKHLDAVMPRQTMRNLLYFVYKDAPRDYKHIGYRLTLILFLIILLRLACFRLQRQMLRRS